VSHSRELILGTTGSVNDSLDARGPCATAELFRTGLAVSLAANASQQNAPTFAPTSMDEF